MSKPCPIQRRVTQVPTGPSVVPGRTQMMLGTRVMNTWNQTTKRFETQTRFGIALGTNGAMVFRFNQSKLI